MNLTLPFLIAAVAVRNPFWPIGYEGVKEEISAEPKVEVRAPAAETDDTATAGAEAQAAEQAAHQYATVNHERS